MLKWLSKKRNQKGFTLIELIVVIAILGILAAIMIPRFTGFQDRARSSAALVEAKQLATAIDSLHAESSPAAYPDDEAKIFKLAFGSETGTTDGKWTFATDYDDTTGGFTWTVNEFEAGRATADDPVKLIEPTPAP